MATPKATVTNITGGEFTGTQDNRINEKRNLSKVKSTDITGSNYSHTDNYDTSPDTTDFYPHIDFSSPELNTAFSLLKEVSIRLSEALVYLRDGNIIGSDDCINRVITLLPELFCCRNIGDGFSSIIVALNYSIRNKNGEFLDERELIAIAKMIKRVSSEPFISFEEALNEIETIEDCGLIVGPGSLSEFMVDESE